MHANQCFFLEYNKIHLPNQINRAGNPRILERSRQDQIGVFFMSTPSAVYFLKKRVIFSAKCPVECCVFQFLIVPS